MAPTVALTGAGGFIGSTVGRRLTQQGYRVRALYRGPPSTRIPHADFTVIHGDLFDDTSLAELLNGADHVIHCAGLVKAARANRFKQVNTTGTARLLEQVCRVAPGATGILVSSLAARHPHLSAYAASKSAAEAMLRDRYAELPWHLVRPPATYGPGDRELVSLWRAMRRGLLPVPGDGQQRISLIHVEDLAALLVKLLEVRPARDLPLEPDDGTAGGYAWPDIARCGEQAFGRRVRIVPIPAAVLRVVGLTNQAAARLLHYAPMLTPGKVRELLHPDWVCSGPDMQGCSGWRPEWSLRESLPVLSL